MTIESSKNLGGIGAILIVVAIVALFAQPVIAFIGILGIVLVLIALHGLADYYKEKGIFNNALIAFIAVIVGIIVTIVGVFYLLFQTTYLTDLMTLIYPGFNGDWSTLQNLTPNTDVNPSAIVPFIGPIVSILAGAWVFAMIGSFFTWRSLKSLAIKSAGGLFSTAGIMLLIGSILIIAFGLGLILMWIAVLLIAIAFFQLKPQPEPVTSYNPPPTSA